MTVTTENGQVQETRRPRRQREGTMRVFIARCIIKQKFYSEQFEQWEFVVETHEDSFRFRTAIDMSDVPFEFLSLDGVVSGYVKGYVGYLTLEHVEFKRLDRVE